MPANRPTQRPNALNGFAGFRVGIIGLSRASFLLLSSVSAAPMTYSSAHHEHVELEAAGSTLWVLYLASVILVLLGGAFAGLTIAYVFAVSRSPGLLLTGIQLDGSRLHLPPGPQR